MTARELDELLSRLPALRIGVIGDYCLDVYWEIDDRAAEKSIETGLLNRPVREQRCALGGAGTIINNLVALGVGAVSAFGVVGEDMAGRELGRLLAAQAVDARGLLVQATDWSTMAYVKPIRGGQEEPRLDLGLFNRLQPAHAVDLARRLADRLDALDAVLVNDQMRSGIHTPELQRALNELMRGRPGQRFIVDARHFNAAYPAAVHRLNAAEAAHLGGTARELYGRWGKPVFVSRGADGCVVADEHGETVVPSVRVTGPVDIVGAGDSMLAGIAVSLAAGSPPRRAAEFGHLVAAVTIQKLHQTGTATPAEVRAIAGRAVI